MGSRLAAVSFEEEPMVGFLKIARLSVPAHFIHWATQTCPAVAFFLFFFHVSDMLLAPQPNAFIQLFVFPLGYRTAAEEIGTKERQDRELQGRKETYRGKTDTRQREKKEKAK